MDFLEIKDAIEASLSELQLPAQLLELQYLAYSFGSGFVSYRIKGYNLSFIYDGRDRLISVQHSAKHEKYPANNWIEVYRGTTENLLNDIQGVVFSVVKERV